MGHVKLHIPGPVEVSEKTFRAFCSPMIGHRGQGFKDLYAKMQPQLQALFSTKQLAYLSTSSAWGVMEGAIRNLVSRKVLNCMCGAFSDKWFEVAKRCGKEAEALQVPWGSPIRADDERPRLLLRLRGVPEKRRAKYDAEHTEHRTRLCVGVQVGGYFHRGPGGALRPAHEIGADDPRLGRAPRFHAFPGTRL